jgi:hypothetical protein
MRILARTFARLSVSDAEVLIRAALDHFLRLLRDTEESRPPVPKFSRLQGVLGLDMSIASRWDEVGFKIGDGSTVLAEKAGGDACYIVPD